jgi:hypothetical protein
MITIILIIGLILSIALNIIAFLLIGIQANKIQTYEQWILEFRKDVEMTLANMQSIDSKGTFATSVNDKGKFESDDEVGQVFEEMKDLIEKLKQRTQ